MCLRNQSLCPRAALSCGFPQPGDEEERGGESRLCAAPPQHPAATLLAPAAGRFGVLLLGRRGAEGTGLSLWGISPGAAPTILTPQLPSPPGGSPSPVPNPNDPNRPAGGSRGCFLPAAPPCLLSLPPYPALAAGPFPYRACCCASARIWAGNSLSALSLPPSPGRFGCPDPGGGPGLAPRCRSDQLHATEGGEQRGDSPGRPLLAGFFPPLLAPSRLPAALWGRVGPCGARGGG